MHDNEDTPKSAGSLARRDFIRLVTLGTAATLLPNTPVMAGPFEATDFQGAAPADKKLDPAWVASLTARGLPETYRGEDLTKIGMPVGGLCAGQLYLGGDGRLWHWDIWNREIGTGDGGYAHPPNPDFPIEQGFALQITTNGATETRRLDRSGFSDITFRGEYPIGNVQYGDPATPVTVALEAFSPFIPLNTEDSSLPATVLRFTLKNTGKTPVQAELAGWLQNAVCHDSGGPGAEGRVNRILDHPHAAYLDCSMMSLPPNASRKPDKLFDNFDKATYEGWEVTGTAFGKGPILRTGAPAYQGDLGGPGKHVVNSHASAPGSDVGQKDGATGTLTSKPFVIDHGFVRFWIGGGDNPGQTCLNVLVDGKVVRSATGRNDNRMREESLDVRSFLGQPARIQIVDDATGAWGNIGVGEIVFTDGSATKIQDLTDYGTLGLALLEPAAEVHAHATVDEKGLPQAAFAAPPTDRTAQRAPDQKLIGALGRAVKLAPGQSRQITFVLAWHFPNDRVKDGGRFYAKKFASAEKVAAYVSENIDRLTRETRLWRDTWYDSTLPYWFLDRTFLNTSILATSTAHRFASGRFYGWEGVGCCEGTCTHVWHYAHAPARLFPDLERDLRERTDFGTAIDPKSGIIQHRGEGAGLAVDGQAGCILRAYREHQMTTDDTFLRRIWPNVRLAMQCLMDRDDGLGILEGPQHNTLDQPWFGKVAWLSSLYVAAARACDKMATTVGDLEFAKKSRDICERGSRNIDRLLFNGEYYIQIPDPANVKTVGSFNGCEIDQVFGDSWARQVGLAPLLPEAHVKTALAALWRYNFSPDVGPWRKTHTAGRWYALPGEAGLLMCTWPKGDQQRVSTGFDFYFNECMTGFEYQVAGHMLWENLIHEGLAVTRAIHDRYHASRRNPWNEVECGDHYSRAMASYGVFLAACGYEHNGPEKSLAFAPRLTPEDFRAPFTTAEGWGTLHQSRKAGKQANSIHLKSGALALKTLAFTPANPVAHRVTVRLNGRALPSANAMRDGRIVVTLQDTVHLKAGQKLEIQLTPA